MSTMTRRDVLRAGAAAAAAKLIGGSKLLADDAPAPPAPPAALVPQDATVEILHARGRVPVSFIIDDSTCLVNMGAYCMPQFAAAYPNSIIYKKPWRDWPREIPDAFVREFGEWCAQAGVRGKYSIVPYPACVGWLDRDLPGWSRDDLQNSLKLVRDVIMPNWDVTPEMVTHTRVIDIKTGRAMGAINSGTMENSYPGVKQSADELAPYIAYALTILKNAGLPCSGITTPGGFGNKCKPELSQAVRQAVTDVFAGTDVPFYFKYISDKQGESTRAKLEAVEGAGTDAPKFVVNVPASIGDEFGGWDGDRPPQGHLYANEDATKGRMVELIEAGEPAVMFGHWAGFYGNGSRKGFGQAKQVITAINTRFADRILWQKSSEMARYQAARELTKIARAGGKVTLAAPVATPGFTLRITKATAARPAVGAAPLTEVREARDLKAGTWLRDKEAVVVCVDLAKGETVLTV